MQQKKSFEYQIFQAQNKFRQHPQLLIEQLEYILTLFQGKTIHFPDNPVGLKLKQGPASYRDAIKFLKIQKPLPPLKWSPQLAKSAADHAKDIGPKGSHGHKGTDGSTVSRRIERYCSWLGMNAENISYGKKSAELIIAQLVVDDNVPGREHRKNIYNPQLCYAGVATAPHKVYKLCCVIDYVTAIGQKGKKQEIKIDGIDLQSEMDKVIEEFKTNDENRPVDTVSSKIKLSSQVKGKNVTIFIKKTYKLKSGKQVVVDVKKEF